MEPELLDRCGYKRYIGLMQAIGIRELKNQLSRYLRMVKEGEIVLVTDRGQVVAQLGPPSPMVGAREGDGRQGLERLARLGRVEMGSGSLPSSRKPPLEAPSWGVDVAALLDETRADRP